MISFALLPSAVMNTLIGGVLAGVMMGALGLGAGYLMTRLRSKD